LTDRPSHSFSSASSNIPGINSPDDWPFPGRWVGGVCLILGPVLLLTGALLRIQFHFFAPQQLQAFEGHPDLMTAAYSTYSVGAVALCLGILALVHRIAAWNRTWAFWGGALAVVGLFNRTFSAGVDHMAFQMVSVLGADQAFVVVSDTYRAFHVFRSANPATMLGWPVLAIGAYRAGVLGPVLAAALALMFMLPFGTLKGTEIRSIAIVGLCAALVPLGVRTLREGPPLSRRARAWIVAMLLLNVTGIVLARLFPVLTN
jgi:hypothetical protein